ncbi:MAG: serine hydrolase domain-containing protein [Candidatus Nanopelagicales bacterium]|nr:serine hydrolase domain-containing protein [Candidatus Nanopelagicales bacterium]MDZ4249063.1 serine hydrolase domain-containing protein [Candidatus Nanopelagicales bacterium]
MSRRRTFTAAVALAVMAVPVLSSCGNQAASDEVGPRMQASVDQVFAQYRDSHALPDGAGVLVRLVSPNGTWTVASGMPEGTSADSHYRIASVSKTFTAASVMLLRQQGKLNIDDRVTQNIPGTTYSYLPATPQYAIPYKDKMTIRQLLSHRAGVFDVSNNPVPKTSKAPYAGKTYDQYMTEFSGPDHQFTVDELAGVLSANKLSFFKPGTDYHYSDTGYNLLVKIVERVSGTPFNTFVADNMLGPIGLPQTSEVWSAYDFAMPAPFMTGYVNVGGGWQPISEDNMSSQVGPGSVVSTPTDMTRWIAALLSGSGPLNAETVAEMTTVPDGNETYGLGISSTELGMGHSGAHPGYVNIVQYDPKQDVSVVVVTPFIDYTRPIEEHLALLVEVGKRAREAAGYPEPWRPDSR